MAMGLAFLGRGNVSRKSVAGAHLLGASLGGASIGGVAGLGGYLLQLQVWQPWIVGGATLLTVAIAIKHRTPGAWPHRQVPRAWSEGKLPARSLYFSWGALLGSGVATVIPYPTVFLLLAVDFTVGPLIGALAGVVYGSARELVAIVAGTGSDEPGQLDRFLPSLQSVLRHANVILTACLGVSIVLLSMR